MNCWRSCRAITSRWCLKSPSAAWWKKRARWRSLTGCTNRGIEIAVDDFGTGHSALIYLERFTMDYLKIDRGFVNTIGQDTVTAPVLDAVISLAKKLKMLTVAEGVETAEQMQFLQEHGVNFMQGILLQQAAEHRQLRRLLQCSSGL